jgi:hypothetical protein
MDMVRVIPGKVILYPDNPQNSRISDEFPKFVSDIRPVEACCDKDRD